MESEKNVPEEENASMRAEVTGEKAPRIRKMKNSGIIQERFKVRRTKRKEVGKSWLPWTLGFFRYFVLIRTVQGQAD